MSMLLNERTGEVIARNVRRPKTPWGRAVGLLCYSTISPDDGLWFDGCSAIHTVGLRHRIDVVFLDRAQRVIGILSRVRPFTPLVYARDAATVIELGADLSTCDLIKGDALRLVA